MQALIENLVGQLGVSKDQAEGGVGLIAKMAQEKLGSGDFGQLAEKIPGLADLATNAPAGDGGGGLGGMVGSALSAFGGGEGLGGIAKLAGSFDKLGIDAGTVAKFVPIVKNYMEENGGDLAKNLLGKLF